jgi:hypothetical protein
MASGHVLPDSGALMRASPEVARIKRWPVGAVIDLVGMQNSKGLKHGAKICIPGHQANRAAPTSVNLRHRPCALHYGIEGLHRAWDYFGKRRFDGT